MAQDWRRGEYLISTDRNRLNVSIIHEFLSKRSYWAEGRSVDIVTRSLDNSLNFGVYKDEELVGFARVVTDYATFAWLADVFILESYRGQALAKWLLGVILSHPELRGFRRWVLATKDAHGLYRQYGFTELREPSRWMEKFTETVAGE